MEIVNNVLAIISSLLAIILSIYQFKNKENSTTDTNKTYTIIIKNQQTIETKNTNQQSNTSIFSGNTIELLVILGLFLSVILVWIYNEYKPYILFLSLLAYIIVSVINYCISIKWRIFNSKTIALQLFVPAVLLMLNKFAFVKLNLTQEYIDTLQGMPFKEFFGLYVANIVTMDTNLYNYGNYSILSMISFFIIIILCLGYVFQFVLLTIFKNANNKAYVSTLTLFFILDIIYAIVFINAVYIQN